MPVLENQRHELFCQALAKGKSTSDAYVEAGFKSNRGNAGELRRKEHIQIRIKELLNRRNEIQEKATVRAIEKTAITKAWVLSMLRENLERAMQYQSVKDDEGNELGIYQYNGSVANKAAELIGRELGMFIDRKDFRVVSDFETLSDAELVQELARSAQLLLEHQPTESDDSEPDESGG